MNNNIRRFPDAPRTLCTEFATEEDDETSTSETYPLHIACSNEVCPSEVIRFLVEQYPPACKHSSNINGGAKCDAYNAAGLPLHYYLAQNINVDIDTVKLLIEAYPQSLMITGKKKRRRRRVSLSMRFFRIDIRMLATYMRFLYIYSNWNLILYNCWMDMIDLLCMFYA